MEWRVNAPEFRLLRPSLSPIQPDMKERRKEWNPQCYSRWQQTEGSHRQKSLERQSHRIWSEDKKKKGTNEAKHSEANVTWNKTDYYSEGRGDIIKSYPNHSKKKSLSFTHSLPPPHHLLLSLESTRQRHPPTTAAAEWMMSNRVGEWGHYRDTQLWIGAPEPSFVPHSRIPLTLKCAEHLTPGWGDWCFCSFPLRLFEAKARWSILRRGLYNASLNAGWKQCGKLQ